MALVRLGCGHMADVDHTMGERLVTCISHDTPIEHVVKAIHINAVTYETRRRTPVPVEAEA